MTTEITIKTEVYRIGKLNAFEQFHVARRLAPALFVLGKNFAGIDGTAEGASMLDSLAGAIGPLAEVIARMTDDESNYVLTTCLGVCSRKQGTALAAIILERKIANPNTTSYQLMFDDIDMAVMLQLVFAVLKDNLGNFLAALPVSDSTQGAT